MEIFPFLKEKMLLEILRGEGAVFSKEAIVEIGRDFVDLELFAADQNALAVFEKFAEKVDKREVALVCASFSSPLVWYR